jgi:hypothetical protein
MSDQKNWDAVMIKIWRNNGTLMDAMFLFNRILGKRATDCDPPLKRFPPGGFPWKVGVKVFVSSYLPKISTWLWDHDADRDIDLLRKLEGSNYDCMEKARADAEHQKAYKETATNKKKIAMAHLAYTNRNNDTNWNIVKGSRVRGQK